MTIAKKRKAGRPRRVFTDAQIKKMKGHALNGCQNSTIATLLGVPVQTLVDNYREVLAKKRAERKDNLRKYQNKAAKDGVPSMLVWLGKNDLGQVDKSETVIGLDKGLVGLLNALDGKTKGLPNG